MQKYTIDTHTKLPLQGKAVGGSVRMSGMETACLIVSSINADKISWKLLDFNAIHLFEDEPEEWVIVEQEGLGSSLIAL